MRLVSLCDCSTTTLIASVCPNLVDAIVPGLHDHVCACSGSHVRPLKGLPLNSYLQYSCTQLNDQVVMIYCVLCPPTNVLSLCGLLIGGVQTSSNKVACTPVHWTLQCFAYNRLTISCGHTITRRTSLNIPIPVVFVWLQFRISFPGPYHSCGVDWVMITLVAIPQPLHSVPPGQQHVKYPTYTCSGTNPHTHSCVFWGNISPWSYCGHMCGPLLVLKQS